MEVMRDPADNCVIICSIENFDPWASTPATHHRRAHPDADRQGISDHARPRGFAVIRAVGARPAARTSSSAVSPENGRMVIIEMNPRVSRSSALASRPPAFHREDCRQTRRRYLLDELRNDITRETRRVFEPALITS